MQNQRCNAKRVLLASLLFIIVFAAIPSASAKVYIIEKRLTDNGSSIAGGWSNNSVRTWTALKVGIGDSTPFNTLSVDGTINATGNIYDNGLRVCTANNGLCNQTFTQDTDLGGGWTNTSIQTSTSLNTVITARNATSVPVTITSAASQSANLQEWQNSGGGVLSYVDAAGEMTFRTGADRGIAFNDGDTSIFESVDDAMVFEAGGTNVFQFTAIGMNLIGAGKAYMPFEVASSTNPVFTFYGDDNTGIGRASADNPSLIAGGAEILRINASGTHSMTGKIESGAYYANDTMGITAKYNLTDASNNGNSCWIQFTEGLLTSANCTEI